MRRKKDNFFVCVGPIKKIIQQVKNLPNFIYFLSIGSKIMWVPHIWEERSDSFRRKKINLSEISAVGFTQMNFNCRQREIDLRFKMNCDLYYRLINM